tara:strand:+ start:16086 stop:17252 length:1167 start_codon:yes stop_codon:yes gene_type:complete
MKIENHILDILQLYEYAMAIGKSLDYKESCDLFLKLILKRKNLNAAWILEPKGKLLHSTYAIPFGKEISIKKDQPISEFLKTIEFSKIVPVDSIVSSISPIPIDKGNATIFNLEEEGYLFLYSKKDNLSNKDLSQLEPVIKKFTINLKACKAFKEQEQLLHNLEVQNQELSDYAHMVSHDLKSPLRSVDTLAAWLIEDNKDKLDEHCSTQLDLIRSNVEKMDALINGILDYSAIGKNQVETYKIDLNLLLKDVLNMMEIPSHISVNMPELPTIIGDKYRLQQLFQNLISNAVKYNDKPKGVIEIGIEEKEQFWQFYIKDNGKGIDEVYFNKIFKVFEKLENIEGSTGVGLSIVKKIVDLYGGKIWLTSEPGKGSTFYFTLKKKSNGEA